MPHAIRPKNFRRRSMDDREFFDDLAPVRWVSDVDSAGEKSRLREEEGGGVGDCKVSVGRVGGWGVWEEAYLMEWERALREILRAKMTLNMLDLKGPSSSSLPTRKFWMWQWWKIRGDSNYTNFRTKQLVACEEPQIPSTTGKREYDGWPNAFVSTHATGNANIYSGCFFCNTIKGK